MRQRIVLGFLLALALVAPRSLHAADDGKIALKILYAGLQDSQRMSEFVEFLEEHFTEVKTQDFTEFTPAKANGYDVVLLDYDGDARTEEPLDLPKDYARPTITIGLMGSFIGSRRSLKTGYL